jgi:hypothetical protein
MLAPASSTPEAPSVLPAELADQRAWVYADLLTGSLWYYAGKPAFKIQFSDPGTRERLYRFAFDRGEPQFVIRDSEAMAPYVDEIQQLGGTLEARGRVAGQPYFHILWPEHGPSPPEPRLGSR